MSTQKKKIVGGVRTEPHVRKFNTKGGKIAIGVGIGAVALAFIVDPLQWLSGMKPDPATFERMEPPTPKVNVEGLPTDYATGGNTATATVATTQAPAPPDDLPPPDLSGLPKPEDSGLPQAENLGGRVGGTKKKVTRAALGFQGSDPFDELSKGGAVTQAASEGQDPTAQMMAMAQGMTQGQGGAAEGGSRADKFRSQNRGQNSMYLGNGPISAKAKPGWGQITPGTMIQAKLATATNSELGGHVTARISVDVYDKATGSCLMLDDRNSEIFGKLSDSVDYGQRRQQAVWKSIHTPEIHLDIGGMDATDASGRTGIDSEVNRHYGRLTVAAIGATFLDVIAGIARSGSNSGTEVNIGTSAANNVASIGQQIIQRELQVKDELQQAIGKPVSLMVDRIIELPCLNRG